MSSVRNSLHRRNHKERSQLSNRKRLGILEKHKDYVLRARDYNAKKQKIKALKQKAAEKNKDEFYFGMIGRQTKNGVHYQDRGNKSLPTDLVKVLKTQDEGYIRRARTVNSQRIDSIKSELAPLITTPQLNSEFALDPSLDEDAITTLSQAGIIATSDSQIHGSKSKSRHIVFVDDLDAAKNYPTSGMSSANQMDEDIEELGLGWKSEEIRLKKLQRSQNTAQTSTNAAELETLRISERDSLIKELKARLERDIALRYAMRELEMQRVLMGKGASQKIRGPERLGDDDDEMDEDEADSLTSKRKRKVRRQRSPDMATYKPRVYKFRAERKR